MKARLIGSFSPDTEIVVDQLPILLGRSFDADIRLTDAWASRRHCEITEAEGALVVRDLGSKHGTYVNGARVAEAVLMPGDRLSAGTASFVVQYQPDSLQGSTSATFAERN